MEAISVGIINYNGKRTILKTIQSLYEMEHVKVKIFVIDDCSTDGSPDLVRQNYPEIPIHVEPKNICRLNVLRNKALKIADSDLLLMTDNDILFDKQCLAELLLAMKSDASIATCTPRLMYWDDPDRIYSADVKMHFLGAAIGEQRGKKVEAVKPEVLPTSGGGILLLNRARTLEVGGFDEDYFIGWGDDGEFYQRLMIAGYHCVYVASAFAYHEDKPFSQFRKYRAIAQIHNRWQFILTHYSVFTMILLIPAFIVFEIVQFAFMLVKKIPFTYIKSNFLVLKSLPSIYRKRKRVQKLRVLSDKQVLFSGNIYVAQDLLKNNGFLKFSLKLLSLFFDGYWKLVRVLIP